MKQAKLILSNEEATRAFAARISRTLPKDLTIYLQGNLGVGKTTFVRFVLQSLGYEGLVKSPTYTLVESYEIASHKFFHFDLYRLTDPAELEYIGVRDYFEENAIRFIEWPERGMNCLPKADLALFFELIDDEKRELTIKAYNDVGITMMNKGVA